MEMVGEHGECQHIHREELSLVLDEFLDPTPAMVIVFPGQRIISEDEAASGDAIGGRI